MSGQNKNIFEYIIFPLNMIQGLLTADESKTRKIVSDIIFFGIANFALNYSRYEESALAKQAVYLYYNKKLPIDFLSKVQIAIGNGDLFLFSETRGFSPNESVFDPDPSEIESMYSFIKKHDIVKIWDWCKLSYHVPHEQIDAYYEVYKEETLRQKSFISKFGKDSTASLKLVMLTDFYKDPPEPDLLSCFIALRSIQGRKQGYMKTYKKTILLRMTGCKSNNVFNEIENPELLARIDQISKRKTFYKLLDRLEDRGLLTGRFILPNTNFYLLSTSVDTIEIARLFAETKVKADRSKKQNEALELFNQLIIKK
jgi:hypothetical protein